LNWEPASQPRFDAGADSDASAVVAQTTRPVRIVGGAIPDPSAGMSAPPPAPQPPAPQRRSAAVPPAQSPVQISPQLLMGKPLGPASQLQAQTATAGSTSGAPQQNPTAIQAGVPTQAATKAAQPTRWGDTLSRAHQNAASAPDQNSAQQQAAPPPAQASERGANKNNDADGKQAYGDAATADEPDRGNTRHGRHSKRHWRGDDDVSASASSSRRQDAGTYDRLYDSYGNRRDRSHRNRRGQPYGENPTFETPQPRSQPFWGGGFYRQGGYQDDF
jgi:hypothetical protein